MFLFLCVLLAFGQIQANTPTQLSSSECSLYSQNGEDGVLAKIFQLISPISRYCVDIGASDGITMSNTYLLRLQGWDSLLLDRAHEIPEYKLHKEFVLAENINQLFEKYSVPEEFDLLSLDVHYNDFHLWNALDAKYRPAVVVIEYNAAYGPYKDLVVQYHPFSCGNGTQYYGASILALYNLGRSKGYSLIYAEESGNNLVFVRDDILQKNGIVFENMNEVEKLYRPSSQPSAVSEKKNWIFNSSIALIKP